MSWNDLALDHSVGCVAQLTFTSAPCAVTQHNVQGLLNHSIEHTPTLLTLLSTLSFKLVAKVGAKATKSVSIFLFGMVTNLAILLTTFIWFTSFKRGEEKKSCHISLGFQVK